MAITKEQIFEACERIFSEGKTPRIEAIRTILGSGSYSTIGKYLREWKEQSPDRADVTATEIPQELTSAAYDALKPVLTLIWDKASESVDSERIKTLEAENDRLREDLEELAGLRTTNKALLDQVGELNQQLALARAGVGVEDGDTFLKLQQERDAIATERQALAIQVDTLTQQLQDKTDDSAILTNRLESLENERQALQSRNQELSVANGQLEPLQQQLDEAKQTIKALQKEKGSNNAQAGTLAGELEYLPRQIWEAIDKEIANRTRSLLSEIDRLKTSALSPTEPVSLGK